MVAVHLHLHQVQQVQWAQQVDQRCRMQARPLYQLWWGLAAAAAVTTIAAVLAAPVEAAAATAATAATATPPPAPAAPPTAAAVCGPVEGLWIEANDGTPVAAWRSIPYAAPPVGQARWQPPAAATCWDGTYNASQFKGICVQADGIGSEDCLYLHVYVPLALYNNPPPTGAPVMAYIVRCRLLYVVVNTSHTHNSTPTPTPHAARRRPDVGLRQL